MELFDNDLYKLLFKFFLNFTVISIIIRFIYYPNNRKKNYLFTYYLIGLIVFFICFTLKKNDLELGLALGLFAIFGILRYRTDPTPIKEMTYLFVIIGISVINALVNKKVSLAELAFTNSVVVIAAFGIERLWFQRLELRKRVVFEKIVLIQTGQKEEIIANLQERTGLKINRISVDKIDFLRDIVNISIFYYPDEQGNLYNENTDNQED